jgi:hypothetical protein
LVTKGQDATRRPPKPILEFYTVVINGDVATYQGAKDWMMVKNEVVRMWMEGIVA